MNLKFDTKREEEVFREILKDINISEMRAELIQEGHQLIQKMIEYFR